MSMIYHEISSTFNFVGDESILVSSKDIESLDILGWMQKMVETENKINLLKVREPVIVNAPPVIPISTPIILQAPMVTQTEPQNTIADAMDEELFEAVFSVNETFHRLRLLQDFLKNNNYNYKNID
jgi:hypothetical protein